MHWKSSWQPFRLSDDNLCEIYLAKADLNKNQISHVRVLNIGNSYYVWIECFSMHFFFIFSVKTKRRLSSVFVKNQNCPILHTRMCSLLILNLLTTANIYVVYFMSLSYMLTSIRLILQNIMIDHLISSQSTSRIF